ncbi:DnaB-like helicase C-terminal domain-containing protein [Ruania alba]|uniref:DnaB-like helicase C terminal domain-containing protein n=1 Tax=Ruania alba TaxID=648782 RepID=A0A1H5H3Y8_9MICO|nr:DnaB-like helicase C-terminal domain-containing protein [Ruania alba]SEE22659.1 DnaB-like helicase C terminal domain-containing protein [Ruania alba]
MSNDHSAPKPPTLGELTRWLLDGSYRARDRRISCGLAELDTFTGGGLRVGGLSVVTAPPGAGSTTFALGLVRSCALVDGWTTLVHATEMDATEVLLRLIAAHAGVDLRALRAGNLSGWDSGRLEKARPALDTAPIVIEATESGVNEPADQVVRRHAEQSQLTLAVVDRRLRDADEVVALRRAARELAVAVVLVVRMHPDSSEIDHPGLAQIPMSQTIKENSDLIVSVQPPDPQVHPERAGESDLTILSNRHGSCGALSPLAWMVNRARFTEMVRHVH